ncbi:hypothetical protein [Vibrio comitans]|uniref:Transposase IS4-like domain-containing protein n=1 Tax=Vibrio comitans NBRC 102076 TaxID=1219078 RepID=A0A4Y3IM56_9VIBR|nr:hypothetical protein [Vibrio comitans]GEA60589.1 hypothetical protein VCO01S_17820 [Vibrio comitans NBRC 102076]
MYHWFILTIVASVAELWGKHLCAGHYRRNANKTDGKRQVWRELHLAVDTDTHEIIAVEPTLSGVTDAEVQPN